MVEVVKHRIFMAAFVTILLFIPLMLVFDTNDLFAVVASLVIVNGLIVAHAFAPGVLTSWHTRKAELEYVDFLTLGVCITWVAISVWAGINLWVRYNSHFQPAVYTSTWLSFAYYMVYAGAVFHLSARRVVKDRAPTVSWPRVGVGAVVGLALGTYVAFTNRAGVVSPLQEYFTNDSSSIQR